MDCVLDASMAVAWALPDERSEKAGRFMRQFLDHGGGRFVVPALWWHETLNAFLNARRKDRLAEEELETAQDLLAQLPIDTDACSGPQHWRRHQRLALHHHLSVYDCVYLELAKRRGIGLATLDERLAEAARRACVQDIF